MRITVMSSTLFYPHCADSKLQIETNYHSPLTAFYSHAPASFVLRCKVFKCTLVWVFCDEFLPRIGLWFTTASRLAAGEIFSSTTERTLDWSRLGRWEETSSDRPQFLQLTPSMILEMRGMAAQLQSGAGRQGLGRFTVIHKNRKIHFEWSWHACLQLSEKHKWWSF